MNTNTDTFSRNTVASLNNANDLLWQAGQIIKANRDGIVHWRATDDIRKSSDKLEKARHLLCNAISDLTRELDQLEDES